MGILFRIRFCEPCHWSGHPKTSSHRPTREVEVSESPSVEVEEPDSALAVCVGPAPWGWCVGRGAP